MSKKNKIISTIVFLIISSYVGQKIGFDMAKAKYGKIDTNELFESIVNKNTDNKTSKMPVTFDEELQALKTQLPKTIIPDKLYLTNVYVEDKTMSYIYDTILNSGENIILKPETLKLICNTLAIDNALDKGFQVIYEYYDKNSSTLVKKYVVNKETCYKLE